MLVFPPKTTVPEVTGEVTAASTLPGKTILVGHARQSVPQEGPMQALQGTLGVGPQTCSTE